MRPWHAPKGMPLTNAVWKMKTNVKAQEEDESAQVWTRLLAERDTSLHYTRFVPHREHRVVFPVLRPSLLLVEQTAKCYWLFVMQYNKSTV